MAESIGALLSASVFGSVLLLLFGKKSRLAPALRLLLSLSLALLLVQPLFSFLQTIRGLRPTLPGSETAESSSAAQAYTLAGAKEIAGRQCTALLCAETGIPADCIRTELILDAADLQAVTVRSVRVTVTGTRYRMFAEKIKACMEKNLLCPCETVFLPAEDGTQQTARHQREEEADGLA